MKHSIALSVLFIFCCSSILHAQQKIGASHPYKSISEVATFYNSNTLTQDLIFELQEDYNPATETYPITFNNNSGNFTLTITKKNAAFSITNIGNSAGGLFILNGCNKVVLQNSQVFNNGSWTIQNSATNAPAIVLQNNASNNIIRNLILEGRTTNTGVIALANSTTGNSNNRIEKNTIRPYKGSEVNLEIKSVANLPDIVDIWQTKITNTSCVQNGTQALIRVNTLFPHNLVAGTPVKIDKVCGNTLANGTNRIISTVHNDTAFTVTVTGTCPALGHNISLLAPLNVISDVVPAGSNIEITTEYTPDFVAGDKVRIENVRGITDANGIYNVVSVNNNKFVIQKSTAQSVFSNSYMVPSGPTSFVFSVAQGGTATRVRTTDNGHGFENKAGQKVSFTNVSTVFAPDPNHYNNKVFDVTYIDENNFEINQPYEDAITVGAKINYVEGGLKGKKFIISEIYRKFNGGWTFVTTKPHGLGANSKVDVYHSGHESEDANKKASLTVSRVNDFSFTIEFNKALVNTRAATVVKLNPATDEPFYKFIKDGIGYDTVTALSIPSPVIITTENNVVQNGQPFLVSGAFNVNDPHTGLFMTGGYTDFNGYHTAFNPAGTPANHLVLQQKTANGDYCPAHLSAPLVVKTKGKHNLTPTSQVLISGETEISGLNGRHAITVLNDSAFFINGSSGQLYKLEYAAQLGTSKQFRIEQGGYNFAGDYEMGNLLEIGGRVHTRSVGIPSNGTINPASGDSIEVTGNILKYLWPKKTKWFVAGYHVMNRVFIGSRLAVPEYSGVAKAVSNTAEIAYGIFSSAAAGQSSGNIITENEVSDFTNTAIFVAATGNGQGWIIQKNHIYKTKLTTDNITGIQLLSGQGNNVIHGNYIGGTEKFAGGEQLMFGRATERTFTGISLNVAAAGATSVTGNVISNVNNFKSNIIGVEILNGLVNVGGESDTLTNLMGSPTDLKTFEYFGEKLQTYDSTFYNIQKGDISARRVTGIVFRNNSSGTIANNTLKNMRYYGAFRGIGIETTGKVLVTNNRITRIIGHLVGSTASNVFGAFMESNITSENVEAIYVNSTNKQLEITGNEISYFIHSSRADIRLVCIDNNTGGNSAGIFASNRIFANILRVFVYDRSSAYGFAKNITILDVREGTDSPTTWNFSNNMISTYGAEGNILAENSNSLPVFNVINHAGTGGTNPHLYYHNSIYVSGGVGFGFSHFYGINSISFFKNGSTPAKLRNNLFVNTRSRSTIHTSKEIIIGIGNQTGFDSDYNLFGIAKDYTVNYEGVMETQIRSIGGIGIGATGAATMTTLTLDSLSSITGGDKNSIIQQPSWEIEPQLNNATYNVEANGYLKLSGNNLYISRKGINVGVATDIYGNARGAQPDFGAHEFSGNTDINNSCYWTGIKSEDWADAGNWLLGRVPDENKSAVISNAPLKANMPYIINQTVKVKDLLVSADEGASIYIGDKGELQIYGDARGWRDSSLVETKGGLITFAKAGGVQYIPSIRRGDLGRAPILDDSYKWSGYDYFFHKNRTKGTVSSSTSASGNLTVQTANPHGLSVGSTIVLSGLTGIHSSANGKNYRILSVTQNAFTVSDNTLSAGTVSTSSFYTALRKGLEMAQVTCASGNCTFTSKVPHGMQSGRLVYINNGNKNSNSIFNFAIVDSVINEMQFLIKRTNTAAYNDVTGTISVSNMCSGYTNMKITGGGIKEPDGICELFGNLELDNGILISDLNEEAIRLAGGAGSKVQLLPLKLLVMKKWSLVSGTSRPSFTGGSDQSYVQGDVAAQLGNRDETQIEVPLGYDGKYRPVKLRVKTGPTNPDNNYYFVTTWKNVDENLPSLSLDSSTFNEKLSKIVSKKYLEVVPYGYDAANWLYTSAFYEDYSGKIRAVYTMNMYQIISRPRDQIQYIEVGLSFKPEDLTGLSTYNKLRVVSDFGPAESGKGFNSAYRPYIPDTWRNTGIANIDSMSDLKYIESFKVPQAFKYMIGEVSEDIISSTDEAVQAGNNNLIDKTGDHHLVAYPNPTDGNFTLVADFNMSSISITSMMGQKVYEQNGKGLQEIQIDKGRWSPQKGMYIIKVTSGDASKSFKLLIY